MSLKKTIQESLHTALHSHDEIAASTLRMLLASFINKEKDKRYKASKENSKYTEQELQDKSQLTDEEIQEVVMSEAKKRKESIEAFERGGRTELADKEKKEMKILQAYLPVLVGKD